MVDRAEDADEIYSRGARACDDGQFEEAIGLIGRAIRLNDRNPAFHYKLGVALQSVGQLLQAEDSYRAAITLDGRHAKALNNLGSLLHTRGQLGAALENYGRALEAQPDLLQAMRNLSIAWQEQGDVERAERFARSALKIAPNDADLFMHLANALSLAGKQDEARAASRRAVELEPENARAQRQLGNALRESRDLAGALPHQRRAVELDSNFAEAWNDLGFLCELRGEVAEAGEHYRRAIALKPDFVHAHFNYSLWLLATGDFRRGWPEYEWRWQLPELARLAPKIGRPSWDGSDPGGKTLLLYAEQGLGDVIQFLRYVPLLTRRDARVLVRCPWQLRTLIEAMPGVSGVFDMEETLPDFDLRCALLSLPRIFGTTLETIPSQIPYLAANQGKVLRWHERIAAHSARLNVGIVWASHTGDARNVSRKSIGLAALAPLGGVGPVVFHSLQKGPSAAESARVPAGMTLVDQTGDIRDFSDTAALIENLDLLISVDTSVAHLAGAMGKPVWVLPTFPVDWRWVPGPDGRNLWYPTARIFQQKRMHEWSDVVLEVADALDALVRTGSGL